MLKTHMVMQQKFFSAALILAWLVTPESLRMMETVSGRSGLWVVVALGFGLALTLTSSTVIHSPKLSQAGFSSDYALMSRVCGEVGALVALFGGRIPVLLFVSTGMLVTAGFAFNEIFLYWFPNFLFAFILLVLVVILNTVGTRHVLFVQSIFVLSTIGFLLALIVLGVGRESVPMADYDGQQRGVNLSLVTLGSIFFLGFDFHTSKNGFGIVFISLSAGALLLLLWAFTAMKFAAPGLLAESMVAHMSIARAIAGESGRHLMGGAVIFGVLSGVNGLFIVARNVFADLQKANVISQSFYHNSLVPIVLGGVIGLMMFSGLAGEQILETRIKASVILWVFYLSLRNFSAGFQLKHENGIHRFLGYLSSIAYFLVAVTLVTSSEEMEYIFWFILAVLTVAMVLSLIWTKKDNSKERQRLDLRRM